MSRIQQREGGKQLDARNVGLQLDMPSVYNVGASQAQQGRSGNAALQFDGVVWTRSMKRLYTLVDRQAYRTLCCISSMPICLDIQTDAGPCSALVSEEHDDFRIWSTLDLFK